MLAPSDWPAVEEDGARPAVARVAADVRAGQVEVVAEEMDEQPPRLDVALVELAVHLDPELVLAHARARSSACRTARTDSTSARCRL
jgi:hypothetical protein